MFFLILNTLEPHSLQMQCVFFSGISCHCFHCVMFISLFFHVFLLGLSQIRGFCHRHEIYALTLTWRKPVAPYKRQSKTLGCLYGVPLQIALWNSGGWVSGWCVIITMIANSIGEWFDANLPHSVMEDLHMCRYLSLTFEATAIKFMAALVFLYSMCVTVCITLCVCDCVWMYVCVCV